jgi:hypothetical protein
LFFYALSLLNRSAGGHAEGHGSNPFDYLKDLFTRLPAAKMTQLKEFTPAMRVRASTGARLPAKQNLS